MKQFGKNLKISQKLLISSLAFAIPIAILLYYVVTGFNTSIEFSEKEKYGVSILEPLSGIIRYIPERQTLAQQNSKDLQSDKLGRLDEKLDSLFAVLIDKTDSWGKYISFDSDGFAAAGLTEYTPVKLLEIWQQLKRNTYENSSVNLQNAYSELVKGANRLIRFAGDKSNLILDPDLDTYYLMDITLLVMPRLTEMLIELENISAKNSSKSLLSIDDSEKLHFYTESIKKEHLDRIRNGLKTSLREDSNFNGESPTLKQTIPPVYTKFENATISFVDALQVFSIDTAGLISSQEVFEKGEKAINESFTFWTLTLSELEILIDYRIEMFYYSRTIALILSLITIAFAAAMLWLTSRGITKPLASITDITTEIAAGDIQSAMSKMSAACKVFGGGTTAHAVTLKDETMRLFCAIKTMTINLDALLVQVRQSGIQVTGSATQISSSARQLESAVAQQASSTNEVSATSKEISMTSQQLAGTMNNITKIAVESAELAEGGMAALEEMKLSLTTLREATSDISNKLQLISDKTANISQVITTITKVANQTNLLSLNAAIEAEKAGEYGTGFSVVAREIRRLADQTSVAALEIEEMITEMRRAVDEGVNSVEQNTLKSNTGSENIGYVIDDLNKALERTRQLVEQFETVNNGMQVQSAGARQISDAMSQLNEAAMQTRSALYEMNTTAEKLNEAVSGLKRELSRFSTSG